MANIFTDVERAIFELLSDNYYIDVVVYGESGYEMDDDKKAVLLGDDWYGLEKRYPNIFSYIEENFEIEYGDEWITIYEDGEARIYRCQPDSYNWQPEWAWWHDEPVSVEVINGLDDSDLIDFLDNQDYLNNPDKAVNLSGFEPRGEYLTDDHSLMFTYTPDPAAMLEAAMAEDSEAVYYFVVDSVAQFGLNFSLYKIAKD